MEPAQGRPRVGILALQGDFEAHAGLLRSLGAEPREVRVPAELDGLDGLIIPGGESTVMTLGVEREGLAEPLRELVGAGTPVLGTCAGMIMLDRAHLGILDIDAERNAFGRQLRSFEIDLDLLGLDGGPLHAVFIRAPWVREHGGVLFVNCGSVGKPKDGDPRGAFALLTATDHGVEVTIERVAYDAHQVAAEVRAAGLPGEYAARRRHRLSCRRPRLRRRPQHGRRGPRPRQPASALGRLAPR